MHAVLSVVVAGEAAEVIPVAVSFVVSENVVVHAVGRSVAPPPVFLACAVATAPLVPQYPAAMPSQNLLALWSAGMAAAVVPTGHMNHLPAVAFATNQFPLVGLVPTLQDSIAVLPAAALALDGHAVQP